MTNSNLVLTSVHGRRVGLDVGGRLLVDPKGAGPRAAGINYSPEAASTAVTNTTTETLFDNYVTIPANTLRPGSLIQVKYQGICTATHTTDTFNHKLYIGGLAGTALLTGTATDVADNDTFWGEYELLIRTIGASGTMVGNGLFKKVPAAEATVTVIDDILASTTIDTTVDQVIGVSATWSVADVGNSVRLDFLRAIVF